MRLSRARCLAQVANPPARVGLRGSDADNAAHGPLLDEGRGSLSRVVARAALKDATSPHGCAEDGVHHRHLDESPAGRELCRESTAAEPRNVARDDADGTVPRARAVAGGRPRRDTAGPQAGGTVWSRGYALGRGWAQESRHALLRATPFGGPKFMKRPHAPHRAGPWADVCSDRPTIARNGHAHGQRAILGARTYQGVGADRLTPAQEPI
jgi:hypothetical protein